MKKDVKDILPFWILIVMSFFLASLWLDKQSFYLFNLIWRILIIAGIHFFGNIHIGISIKQWVVLGLIFVLNCWLVYYFFPSLSFLDVIVTIGFGPLAEEIFFRGWVISKLRGNNKDKIIRSSFLFALYHLKNIYILTPLVLVYQILFAGLVVGPIFAWVRLKYNSLFPVIVLHGFNNMIGSTITEKLLSFIIQRIPKFRYRLI